MLEAVAYYHQADAADPPSMPEASSDVMAASLRTQFKQFLRESWGLEEGEEVERRLQAVNSLMAPFVQVCGFETLTSSTDLAICLECAGRRMLEAMAGGAQGLALEDAFDCVEGYHGLVRRSGALLLSGQVVCGDDV